MGTRPSLVSGVCREGWNNSNRSSAGTTNPSRPVCSTPTDSSFIRSSSLKASHFLFLFPATQDGLHKKDERGGAEIQTLTMDVAPGRERRSPSVVEILETRGESTQVAVPVLRNVSR